MLQGDAIATLPLPPMRLKLAALTAALLVAILALALGGAATGAQPPRAPSEFFGIGPQTSLTDRDAEYMRAGGIGVVRMAVPWSSVQERRKRGVYNWAGLDQGVEVAARNGLKVLPFLYGTPHWLAAKPTTLPVDTAQQQREWKAFLTAAVERYGPEGDFWAERAPGSGSGGVGPFIPYEPVPPKLEPIRRPIPIRTWQIWNEANFFYFALPASPSRYAKLVKISSQAIKAVDPSAKVILSGLFAKPTAPAPEGDARGAVPRSPLQGAGPEGPLRRNLPSPLRGRHGNARNYTVTGAGGLSIPATAVPAAGYANNNNAGINTASASYSYPGDANHLGSTGSETFTIDKASSTSTVMCPAGVTYTGAPDALLRHGHRRRRPQHSRDGRA